MVPLSALLRVRQTAGPERAMRYNGFSPPTSTRAPPRLLSGQAQDAAARIAAETLPRGFAFEWTDLTYQEFIAGNSGMWVFRWRWSCVSSCSPPNMRASPCRSRVLMIVPMGLLAAMFGVWLSAGDNNVFTQIGLIVLVGLSAKKRHPDRGIARELEFAGRSPIQAAIEASRLRLRPILMTSMAFIMGVLPLVTATGGLGDAQRHGCRGLLRHDRRDGFRPVPHPGFLRAAPPPLRQPASQAARGKRRDHPRRKAWSRRRDGGGQEVPAASIMQRNLASCHLHLHD